jgi:hypothetical protein
MLIPEASSAVFALGPSLPVSTASTPCSLILWAAAIPAPWVAWAEEFSILWIASDSVSMSMNQGALPKAASVVACISFPAAVIQSFM